MRIAPKKILTKKGSHYMNEPIPESPIRYRCLHCIHMASLHIHQRNPVDMQPHAPKDII